MKKPPFEEDIRNLVKLSENPLIWIKQTLEDNRDTDTPLYSDTILALRQIKNIKELLGDYIPEEYRTKLKQITIEFY